jgi:hypothetical protein
LQKFKHHASLLDRLEKEHSGITRVDRDEDGAIVMGELPDPETLLREINEVLENQKST